VSAVTVYTLRQCSTCKDALKWLEARGVPHDIKAIRETPPALPELHAMLAAYDGQIRRLFNSSGIEYRALGIAAKLPELTEAEALKLLAGNGSLVKRPFLIGKGVALVGFDPQIWAAVLKTQ
jgi:arsenate reductase